MHPADASPGDPACLSLGATWILIPEATVDLDVQLCHFAERSLSPGPGAKTLAQCVLLGVEEEQVGAQPQLCHCTV